MQEERKDQEEIMEKEGTCDYYPFPKPFSCNEMDNTPHVRVKVREMCDTSLNATMLKVRKGLQYIMF